MDHPEFKTIITVEGVSELKVEDAVNDLLQSLPLKAVLRYPISSYSNMSCIALHCIALYCIALYCFVLWFYFFMSNSDLFIFQTFNFTTIFFEVFIFLHIYLLFFFRVERGGYWKTKRLRHSEVWYRISTPLMQWRIMIITI